MRALVIGFGSIGKRHAKILKEIAGSVDVVSQQSNIGYRVFASLDQVHDIQSYDYFVIAKATADHFPILMYLEKHVQDKIILVEKPLFSKLYDFEPRQNTVLVAYNLRFHPVISYLKKELKFQKILSVSITTGQYLPEWRPESDYTQSYSAKTAGGGGVLLDLSHEFDYLTWLFGKITAVKSYTEHIPSLGIETEAISFIVGKLESGTLFSLHLDYLSKIPIRQMIIHTETTSYVADLVTSSIRQRKFGEDESLIELDSQRGLSYRLMHQAVQGTNTRDMLTSTTEALDILGLIDQIKGES